MSATAASTVQPSAGPLPASFVRRLHLPTLDVAKSLAADKGDDEDASSDESESESDSEGESSGSQVVDMAWHPHKPLFATAHVDGSVTLYRLPRLTPKLKKRTATSTAATEQPKHTIIARLHHHKESCRAIVFHPSGDFLYTGSADKSIAIIDMRSIIPRLCFHLPNAHASALNCLELYDANWLVSGDDDGFIRVWDLRAASPLDDARRKNPNKNILKAITPIKKQNKGAKKAGDEMSTPQPNHPLGAALHPLISYEDCGDYISCFLPIPSRNKLVATSGDGHLYVYELRIGHVAALLRGKPSKSLDNQSAEVTEDGFIVDTFFAMSEPISDDLSSVCLLKRGRKLVVAGRDEGVINIFKWDHFGVAEDHFSLDVAARASGVINAAEMASSIECMLKIDEDTVVTASSDGLVRLVQIHPNKLIAVLGNHEEFPVECIKLSPAIEGYFEVEQPSKEDDEEAADEGEGEKESDAENDEEEDGDADDSDGSQPLLPRFLASTSHDGLVKFWNVSELFEVDPAEEAAKAQRDAEETSGAESEVDEEEDEDGSEKMDESSDDDEDEEEAEEAIASAAFKRGISRKRKERDEGAEEEQEDEDEEEEQEEEEEDEEFSDSESESEMDDMSDEDEAPSSGTKQREQQKHVDLSPFARLLPGTAFSSASAAATTPSSTAAASSTPVAPVPSSTSSSAAASSSSSKSSTSNAPAILHSLPPTSIWLKIAPTLTTESSTTTTTTATNTAGPTTTGSTTSSNLPPSKRAKVDAANVTTEQKAQAVQQPKQQPTKNKKKDLNSDTSFFASLPPSHPMHPQNAPGGQRRSKPLKVEKETFQDRATNKRKQLQEKLAKKREKEARRKMRAEQGETDDDEEDSDSDDEKKSNSKGKQKKAGTSSDNDSDDDSDAGQQQQSKSKMKDSDDSGDDSDDSEADDGGGRKLSAKERRKLAKQERRKNPFFSGL